MATILTLTRIIQSQLMENKEHSRIHQHPNSDIVLADTSQPIIWIKKTDGNGNASVTPYDISLHIQKPAVTNEELLAKINSLEEELNNVKSNNGSGNWKQQQSNSKPNSNK